MGILKKKKEEKRVKISYNPTLLVLAKLSMINETDISSTKQQKHGYYYAW